MHNLIDKTQKISLVFIASLTMATVQAQDYTGFTLEESRAYHQQFFQNNPGHSPNKWDQGGDISRYIYLHSTEFWTHSVINRAGAVRELPVSPREDVANFITKTRLGERSLKDYVRNSTVDGVVIVHNGNIVFEDYPRMFPSDKHIYFSVSKTFVSTAIAILEARSQIDVCKSIDSYFPKLKNSDWEGIQVIDILDMSSGMNCLLEFDDPTNCFQKSWDAYGWSPNFFAPSYEKVLDDPLDYFVTIPSLRPPAQIFEYADINPLILTLLVEQISGLSFIDFLKQEIWQRIGAESDALMLNAAFGRAATPLGVSSNLRDMARYGLLFTPSGRKGPNRVLTDTYIQKIQKGGRPELLTQTSFRNFFEDESWSHNTYQWDHVTHDGDFWKAGHAGQGLYISPNRDLVIAYFGTWNEDQILHKMAVISRQLATSGLFE